MRLTRSPSAPITRSPTNFVPLARVTVAFSTSYSGYLATPLIDEELTTATTSDPRRRVGIGQPVGGDIASSFSSVCKSGR